jgi:hypothetical protein
MYVLWDGRRDGPGGAQLFVEEESAFLARQRPYRTMRDLGLTERRSLAAFARLWGVDRACLEYHVSENTVLAAMRWYGRGQA